MRTALPAAALAAALHATAEAAGPHSLADGSPLRSAEARSRLARELAEEVSSVLARIGTPAPDQARSVMEEFAAIERLRDPIAVNARAQRLYAGPVFQQLRLANTLAAVREALHCAASPYGSLRREMACWAIAGANLADRGVHDDALDVLLRNGRLAYGAGMTRARWLALPARWSRYAIGIQESITIPYVRGALE